METESKACVRCAEIKILSDFCISKREKSGYCAHCKKCHNKNTKRIKDLQRALKPAKYIRAGYKKCYSCQNQLLLENFHKKHDSPDGHGHLCKKCKTEQYYKNIERNKEKRRKSYIKNRQKEIDNAMRWRANNPWHYKEYSRNYKREWKKEKIKTDINFRFLDRVRQRINKAISNSGKKKPERNKGESFAKKMLGVPVEVAVRHLESKFTANMSWDTYGLYGWHIDHIIPCDYFDMGDEEDLKKCFHYTNLQPLWATTEIAIKNGESPDYVGNFNKRARIL